MYSWGGGGSLYLDVQGQGVGKILDVNGQGEGGSWKLYIFHGRHFCIVPKSLFLYLTVFL